MYSKKNIDVVSKVAAMGDMITITAHQLKQTLKKFSVKECILETANLLSEQMKKNRIELAVDAPSDLLYHKRRGGHRYRSPPSKKIVQDSMKGEVRAYNTESGAVFEVVVSSLKAPA